MARPTEFSNERDVLVNLSLRDRQGKPFEKTVAYQISLTPGPAVLRSEP